LVVGLDDAGIVRFFFLIDMTYLLIRDLAESVAPVASPQSNTATSTGAANQANTERINQLLLS
jgi:hypothetical protein